MSDNLESGDNPTRRTVLALTTAVPVLAGATTAAAASTQAPAAAPSGLPDRDGQNDFDFLIGDWSAHVRRLPDRLNGSNTWIAYEGTSNHRKLFEGPANIEDFKVTSRDGSLTMHNQTLRLYNRETRQWSIYLLDTAEGTLGLPPVIGEFKDGRGELYDQEIFKGRAIFVRYQWFDISPRASRMEQAFSADGGRAWETNWICELSRNRP